MKFYCNTKGIDRTVEKVVQNHLLIVNSGNVVGVKQVCVINSYLNHFQEETLVGLHKHGSPVI